MSIVFVCAFFAPGFFLGSIFLPKAFQGVLMAGLSLAVYSGLSIFLIVVGVSNFFLSVYFLLVSGIFVVCMSSKVRREKFVGSCKEIFSAVPVALFVWIYSWKVGPFVDHGVDLFKHMSDIQASLHFLETNNGHLLNELGNIGTSNHLFHNLSAIFASYFQLSGPDLIPRISFVYGLIWSITVFFFSRFCFLNIGFVKKHALAFGYLATIIFWVTMGINSFSFPRYYFASPAILTYCGYLGLVCIGIKIFRSGDFEMRLGLVFFVISAVIFYLHPQEFLLIILLMGSIGVVYVVKVLFGLDWWPDLVINKKKTKIVFSCMATAVFLSVISLFIFDRSIKDTTRLLDIGPWLLFEEPIYVLKPWFQFFNVVGWWGLAVYFLAIANIKSLKNSGFLVAVVIFPLVTVFNPIYSELFLRLQNSLTLWRALYAIPLPILGISILYITFDGWNNILWRRKGLLIGQVIVLIVLLVPKSTPYFGVSMTRWPSLLATPEANSYRHWDDLIAFLRLLPQQEDIITDPATGYAISALTKHKTYTKKFYGIKHGIRFNYDQYDEATFEKKRGWILIINRRDGAINTKLEKPFHVPPDVMVVSDQYDPSLIEFVIQSKETYFKELWRNNQISVLRIL
jgi:hypothetical protein